MSAEAVKTAARPSEGFDKSLRLRRRADFVRVQSSRARVTTPHFVFLFDVRRGGPGDARIGIVVSKKLGNAVVRNRVKRLCREAFRKNRDLFLPNVDFVVIARDGAAKLGLLAIIAEWSRAREKLAKSAVRCVPESTP